MPDITRKEEKFGRFLLDRWERLRRHVDYRRFCRKYRDVFDDIDGVLMAGMGFLDDPEANAQLLKVKKRFRLQTVYHYDCDFSATDLLAFPGIYKSDLAVEAGTIKRMNGGLQLSFVIEPPYVDCRIDLSPVRPLKEIQSELITIITHARAELYGKPGWVRNSPAPDYNITYGVIRHGSGFLYCRIEILPVGPIKEITKAVVGRVKQERHRLYGTDSRQRLRENMEAYEVYDKRLFGLNYKDCKFETIGRDLNLKRNTVLKKFDTAYHLIYQEVPAFRLYPEDIELDQAEQRLLKYISQRLAKFHGTGLKEKLCSEDERGLLLYEKKGNLKEYDDVTYEDLYPSSRFDKPHELIELLRDTCRSCDKRSCSKEMIKMFNYQTSLRQINCPKLKALYSEFRP